MLDEIFKKLEGRQLLTPSEIIVFYREYNDAHKSRHVHDGTQAKVVTLYRNWKKEKEFEASKSPVAEVAKVAEPSAETATTTVKKK